MAVLAEIAQQHADLAGIAQRGAHLVQRGLPRLGRMQEAAVAAQHLFRPVACHAFEARVDVDQRQVRLQRIGHADARRHRFDHAPQQAQLLVGLAPLGDVLHGAEQRHHLFALVALDVAAREHPAVLAVAADHLQLQRIRLAFGDGAAGRLAQAVVAVGAEELRLLRERRRRTGRHAGQHIHARRPGGGIAQDVPAPAAQQGDLLGHAQVGLAGAQVRLHGRALRDVGDPADHAHGTPVLAAIDAGADLHRAHGAAGVDHAADVVPGIAIRMQRGTQAPAEDLHVFGMHELLEGQRARNAVLVARSQQRVAAEQAVQAGIGPRLAGGDVPVEDPVVGGARHALEALGQVVDGLVMALDGHAHLVEGAFEQRQLVTGPALLGHARGKVARGIAPGGIDQRIDARQHQPPHRHLDQRQQQHQHQPDGTTAGQRDIALLARHIGRVDAAHEAQPPAGHMRHGHRGIGTQRAVGVGLKERCTRLGTGRAHQVALGNTGHLLGRVGMRAGQDGPRTVHQIDRPRGPTAGRHHQRALTDRRVRHAPDSPVGADHGARRDHDRLVRSPARQEIRQRRTPRRDELAEEIAIGNIEPDGARRRRADQLAARIGDAQRGEIALVVDDAADEAGTFVAVQAQDGFVRHHDRQQLVRIGQHHAHARRGALGFVREALFEVIGQPVPIQRHAGNRHDDGRQRGHRGQGEQATAQRGGKESMLRHLDDR